MPKMTGWRDRISWSIPHDCEMARVSGFDDHGNEFWMRLNTGAGYRERRNQAVIRIQEAIEAVDDSGLPVNQPGRVA